MRRSPAASRARATARWRSSPAAPAQDFARAAPLFAPLGRATHLGPAGSGQLTKLANQVIVGGTLVAIAEALVLARSGGADPAAVREALMGGFGDSKVLRVLGARMVSGDFVPGSPAQYQLKDMRTAQQLAGQAGLRLAHAGRRDPALRVAGGAWRRRARCVRDHPRGRRQQRRSSTMTQIDDAAGRVTLEVSSRIATITLDRPAKHNAITPAMAAQLAEACRAADSDPEVRVVRRARRRRARVLRRQRPQRPGRGARRLGLPQPHRICRRGARDPQARGRPAARLGAGRRPGDRDRGGCAHRRAQRQAGRARSHARLGRRRRRLAGAAADAGRWGVPCT